MTAVTLHETRRVNRHQPSAFLMFCRFLSSLLGGPLSLFHCPKRDSRTKRGHTAKAFFPVRFISFVLCASRRDQRGEKKRRQKPQKGHGFSQLRSFLEPLVQRPSRKSSARERLQSMRRRRRNARVSPSSRGRTLCVWMWSGRQPRLLSFSLLFLLPPPPFPFYLLPVQ